MVHIFLRQLDYAVHCMRVCVCRPLSERAGAVCTLIFTRAVTDVATTTATTAAATAATVTAAAAALSAAEASSTAPDRSQRAALL
jgi:hypothetical protein